MSIKCQLCKRFFISGDRKFPIKDGGTTHERCLNRTENAKINAFSSRTEEEIEENMTYGEAKASTTTRTPAQSVNCDEATTESDYSLQLSPELIVQLSSWRLTHIEDILIGIGFQKKLNKTSINRQDLIPLVQDNLELLRSHLKPKEYKRLMKGLRLDHTASSYSDEKKNNSTKIANNVIVGSQRFKGFKLESEWNDIEGDTIFLYPATLPSLTDSIDQRCDRSHMEVIPVPKIKSLPFAFEIGRQQAQSLAMVSTVYRGIREEFYDSEGLEQEHYDKVLSTHQIAKCLCARFNRILRCLCSIGIPKVRVIDACVCQQLARKGRPYFFLEEAIAKFSNSIIEEFSTHFRAPQPWLSSRTDLAHSIVQAFSQWTHVVTSEVLAVMDTQPTSRVGSTDMNLFGDSNGGAAADASLLNRHMCNEFRKMTLEIQKCLLEMVELKYDDVSVDKLIDIGSMAEIHNMVSVPDICNGGYTNEELKGVCSSCELKSCGVPLQAVFETRFADVDIRCGASSVACLRDSGWTVQRVSMAGFSLTSMIAGGYSIGELREGGYSVAELLAGGVTCRMLREGGFTAKEMKMSKIEVSRMRNGGFDISELLDALFPLTDILSAGYPLTDAKRAGCSISELLTAGCLCQELRMSGFTVTELYSQDVSISELKKAGYDVAELIGVGISLQQLRLAGFVACKFRAVGISASDLQALQVPAVELITAGYSPGELYDAGYSASELRAGGGSLTAQQLRAAGYSAGEVMLAGYSVMEVTEGGYTARDMRVCGFTAQEMVVAGWSCSELRVAGFSAQNLMGIIRQANVTGEKESGANVTGEKESEGGLLHTNKTTAKFTVSDLRFAGFSATQLVACHCSVTELQEGGYTAQDLRSIGCTAGELLFQYCAADLKKAGYSLLELQSAGMDPGILVSIGFDGTALRAVGFYAFEMIEAGFNIRDILSFGFTVAEMREDAFGVAQMKKSQLTAAELREGGYTAKEVKDELESLVSASAAARSEDGIVTATIEIAQARQTFTYSVDEMREGGYTVTEMQEGGYTVTEMRKGGYTVTEMRKGGYTVTEMREGGYTVTEMRVAGYTVTEMREGGYAVTEMREVGYTVTAMREGGYACSELYEGDYLALEMRLAGYSAAELILAGYSLAQLREGSYLADALVSAGVTVKSLLQASFSVAELKEAAGFSCRDFRRSGCVAADVHSAGFSCREMKMAGYEVEAVKALGYSASALHKAGYCVVELKNGGFTPLEINSESGGCDAFSAQALRMAGYTAAEMISGLYTVTQLRQAGYSVVEVREAQSSTEHPQQSGFHTEELCQTGDTTSEKRDSGIEVSLFHEGISRFASCEGDDRANDEEMGVEGMGMCVYTVKNKEEEMNECDGAGDEDEVSEDDHANHCPKEEEIVDLSSYTSDEEGGVDGCDEVEEVGLCCYSGDEDQGEVNYGNDTIGAMKYYDDVSIIDERDEAEQKGLDDENVVVRDEGLQTMRDITEAARLDRNAFQALISPRILISTDEKENIASLCKANSCDNRELVLRTKDLDVCGCPALLLVSSPMKYTSRLDDIIIQPIRHE